MSGSPAAARSRWNPRKWADAAPNPDIDTSPGRSRAASMRSLSVWNGLSSRTATRKGSTWILRMGVKSPGANGIRPVAMFTVPLAVNTPSTYGSPARPFRYCIPAAPAPPCRVMTVTRCPPKCSGAASASARASRSLGPPGVAHETISIGRLGNGAWSGAPQETRPRPNGSANRRTHSLAMVVIPLSCWGPGRSGTGAERTITRARDRRRRPVPQSAAPARSQCRRPSGIGVHRCRRGFGGLPLGAGPTGGDLAGDPCGTGRWP